MTETATRSRAACPICDQPIADTGYVCTGCTNRLRHVLLNAADRLGDLQHTLVHGTVTDSHRGPGAITAPPAIHGPFCPGCEHRSCHVALDTQWRAAHHAAAEQPIPHEAANPFNLPASDALWEFQNTVTTWARHIVEERQITLPQPRPRPILPTKVVKATTEHDRPGRCICCDLPTYSCHRARKET